MGPVFLVNRPASSVMRPASGGSDLRDLREKNGISSTGITRFEELEAWRLSQTLAIPFTF